MRRLAICFTIAVLQLVGLRGAGATGVAFILNSGAASVSVVDMTSLKEVRRIPVMREPHHLVMSPDGKSLMVGDTVGNEMLFLDPVTGDVRRRMPMSDPYQFGFSPDNRFFTVAALARNQIDVYDGGSLTLLKRFQVVATPSHLAYMPDSSAVYVSLQDSDRLIAIDLKKLDVKWNQPVGKTPAGVMWHDGHVLVANMGTDHVAQVDPATGRVVRKIQTGKGAHTVFMAPDRKLIWVNNRASGTTVSLDPVTLNIVRTYRIPGGPDDIDFTPDGKLWITRRWAEKVAVLDPATGNYENVQVGRSPHGLYLNAKAPSPSSVAMNR
ncbi:MAG: YncE family protein [Acetobacteraceae bacterium]